MADFRQWGIERRLIPAEVIILVEAARLYSDEITRAQKDAAVALVRYLDVDGCIYHVDDIGEQLSAHLPREGGERSALTSVRTIVNN